MTQTATKHHVIPARLAAVRDELAARRTAGAARRRLSSELADYRTETERNDLNALLDHYSDDDVAEVRDLLNRRVAA